MMRIVITGKMPARTTSFIAVMRVLINLIEKGLEARSVLFVIVAMAMIIKMLAMRRMRMAAIMPVRMLEMVMVIRLLMLTMRSLMLAIETRKWMWLTGIIV